jgi:hypothetical protein
MTRTRLGRFPAQTCPAVAVLFERGPSHIRPELLFRIEGRHQATQTPFFEPYK